MLTCGAAMSEVIQIIVNNRTIPADRGASLLETILKAKHPIATSCGGQGSCHLCRLTILKSAQELPSPNDIEVKALGNVCISAGMRLACQVHVHSTLKVDVPKPRKKKKR